MFRPGILVLLLAVLGASEALRPLGATMPVDDLPTIGAWAPMAAGAPARGKGREAPVPAAVVVAAWQVAGPPTRPAVSAGSTAISPSTRPADHRLPARAPPTS